MFFFIKKNRLTSIKVGIHSRHSNLCKLRKHLSMCRATCSAPRMLFEEARSDSLATALSPIFFLDLHQCCSQRFRHTSFEFWYCWQRNASVCHYPRPRREEEFLPFVFFFREYKVLRTHNQEIHYCGV